MDAYRSPAGGASLPFEITHGPSFSMLRCDLSPGTIVRAESGAMVACNDTIDLDARLNAPRNAGFGSTMRALGTALVRKALGGETFFVTDFSARAPGSVWLAPTMSGSIQYRRMSGEKLVLSRGAYLASVGDIDLGARFGGLRGLFAREGLFFLEASGSGDLFFTSYGGIQEIDVDGTYIVDNGHLVAYEGDLTFDIRTAGGGLMGFFASGEGLVCEFKGRGKVYIQSRNIASLVSWVSRHLPG